MAKLTLYNVRICMTVAIGGFTYGFGFAVFITSIGQPDFFSYFNLNPSSTYAANVLGAVNALFAFGAAVGAIVQGWTADWLGRRKALALAAGCALVGGALTAGSVTISMLIIVRILQGFGLGMLLGLVLLYTTEVAPAHKRGLISGMTVMGFGLGYTIDAFVSLGTFYSTNEALSWRMPLALACVGPFSLLIGLLFVPESPRYLLWVNKNDQAWKVIRRLHHDPNSVTDSAALAEFIQISKQVEFDREQKAGYINMFKKPSWRLRSFLVIFIFFAAQSTGILGIANYIVIIFGGLGLDPAMCLGMYAVYSVVGTASNFIVCCFMVDRVGRRRLFLMGFPGLACILFAETLLQWKFLDSDNKGGLGVCLLFIFIYIIVYQFIDCASFVFAAEIFPTVIRAKGIGLTLFAYFVGAITYTTPAALAFKNIKYGMYGIWAALCAISAIIVYFYIPETRMVPMEELGALFGDEVIVHLTADGQEIVDSDKATIKMFIEGHHEEIENAIHEKVATVNGSNTSVN